MEAAMLTRGVLSLPSKPLAAAFPPHPAAGGSLVLIRRKTTGALPTPRLTALLLKASAFGLKRADFAVCKAEAAAAAAAGGEVEGEKAKLFGVEVQTLKKIVPLGLMFFCILFNYTILRDTKDVLVVTAKGSSAEILPFLKTWVTLPMAVGFMLLYKKLANVLSKEAFFTA